MALSSCSGKKREGPYCDRSLLLCSLWKSRCLAPCHERLLPERTIMGGSHQVSATAKQVVDGTMNGEKTLSMSWRLEASHLALSLPSRLMRNLSPIIQVSVLAMGDTGQQLPARHSIAAQLIGDKETRHIEQTFQQLTKEALAAR